MQKVINSIKYGRITGRAQSETGALDRHLYHEGPNPGFMTDLLIILSKILEVTRGLENLGKLTCKNAP